MALEVAGMLADGDRACYDLPGSLKTWPCHAGAEAACCYATKWLAGKLAGREAFLVGVGHTDDTGAVFCLGCMVSWTEGSTHSLHAGGKSRDRPCKLGLVVLC